MCFCRLTYIGSQQQKQRLQPLFVLDSMIAAPAAVPLCLLVHLAEHCRALALSSLTLQTAAEVRVLRSYLYLWPHGSFHVHVQFDLAHQTASGELVALIVRLQQKAPRPETLRLLGCVVTLKEGFGFVRCDGPHVVQTHLHSCPDGLSARACWQQASPMWHSCLLPNSC